MSAALPSGTSPRNARSKTVTLHIISIVLYTFIAFLCIGLPIAVIPGYVHNQLGFSAVVAGMVIGSQYLATLCSRPLAGRVCDTLGTKRAIVFGLAGISVSGILTVLAVLLESLSGVSLGMLVIARVILGVSQGLVGVGTISWCIGLVGAEHTARSISWNGIASYGAIAIGAPFGVVMVSELGFVSLGLALTALSVVALLLIRHKAPVPVVRGERMPFWSVFGRVAPHGTGLMLSSIGYGTLTTFITLYYVNQSWEGAAWCLTLFGICFIAARLMFINAIARFGGYRSALVCMAIETLGLMLLWLAPSPAVALIGAGLVGVGMSQVYPAIGVEAIKRVPDSSRGAGLGAYAVFLDLSLAIAGPLMGAIALGMGYDWIFFVAALLSVLAMAVIFGLWRSEAEGRRT